ncbi:60S ribosomal protein L22 [Mucor velutinosus]|uniref:60S ribosomal protein L22 n=1 Tax=Mucor velutinosus TaxID=708070 RepID=A0AAN7I329_9FUNG|nr:60S ribosomal protein L22 [Mucor velutinosus]
MPIVSEPVAVSSTGFYQQPATSTTIPPPTALQPPLPNAGNAFLIAIEVIFSCLVIVVLLFCYFTGVHKKKRARVNQQQMIENAITQQERRIQLHLQGQCHSSSTVTTLVQCPPLPAPPPPTYAPPDPRHSLPKDVVARLDYLLEQNQICTTTTTTTTTPRASSTTTTIRETLPAYTDVYRQQDRR